MEVKKKKEKNRIMNETADERAATDEVMRAQASSDKSNKTTLEALNAIKSRPGAKGPRTQSFSKVLKRLHALLRGEEQGKLKTAKHHVLLRGEDQARIQRGPNPGPSSKTSKAGPGQRVQQGPAAKHQKQAWGKGLNSVREESPSMSKAEAPIQGPEIKDLLDQLGEVQETKKVDAERQRSEAKAKEDLDANAAVNIQGHCRPQGSTRRDHRPEGQRPARPTR